MKIKAGANIQGLNIAMRKVLIEADRIWGSYGQELVITCGLNGAHSAGSLHYYGYAIDLRTNYFADTAKEPIRQELQNRLGPDYDVVLHSSHIHVEYQLILNR